MRLGYTNVHRMPHGYFGWLEREAPEESSPLTLASPGIGDFFPSCRLMLLNFRKDREYLGISNESRLFSLEDVETDYLFVEFYNEHCSECLQEVSNFKSLYHLLDSDAKTGGQVRMMGIAAGSKKRNVVKFRKKQAIPFPLFADERWELFKCLGNPLLPVSYLLKREGSRRKILMIHSGHAGSGEILLKKIMSAMPGPSTGRR